MTATRAALPVIPSLDKVEMEERKRALLPDGDDSAPSRKRLRDENGNVIRMSEDKEKDVEDYQKDAILRQMKEYKRQKKDAEDQLLNLRERTVHHNDHLRIIDAWFAQLLGEIRVLASQLLPTPPPSASPSTGEELYTSALLFENNETFSTHLKTRSDGIKGAITDLFGRLPSASPDVEDLRRQLNELLAKEKEHAVELRKAIDDKQLMLERLEQSIGRYMTAERRLDRMKSTQVLKLERQAVMSVNTDSASPTAAKGGVTPKREHAKTNGELENGVASEELESSKREAIVALEKQKAQLEEVEKDNERLTNELSAARTKLASLSDDDYANTSLFRTLRSQHEAALKRVNDLEATTSQLRQETQRLHSERTTYRTQLDEETRNHTNEIEVASARAETDLARIRHTRDQLHSDLAVAKSMEESNRSSLQQARELAEATQQRIAALESHVTRLQLQTGEAQPEVADLEPLKDDALKAKLRTLQSQYSLLSNELPSMEAAWRKAQVLAAKRIEETQSWEEQVARSAAEKAKADQKYFAAMKAKDTRENEVRSLKSQNARSSEIVSQLKDVEAKTKELCGNFERQLADAKDGLARLEQQHRQSEQKLREVTLSSDGLKQNVEELKSLTNAKDKENLAVAKAKRDVEEDLEKTKARLEESKKQFDTLRKSRASINSADSDDWRKVAICPVCNSNIRNTALKLCGHVFCSACIKDLISNRSRKCPSCSKAFGANDSMSIVLT